MLHPRFALEEAVIVSVVLGWLYWTISCMSRSGGWNNVFPEEYLCSKSWLGFISSSEKSHLQIASVPILRCCSNAIIQVASIVIWRAQEHTLFCCGWTKDTLKIHRRHRFSSYKVQDSSVKAEVWMRMTSQVLFDDGVLKGIQFYPHHSWINQSELPIWNWRLPGFRISEFYSKIFDGCGAVVGSTAMRICVCRAQNLPW